MKCCNTNDVDNGDNDAKENVDINLDGLICYCFKYSKQELFDAVKNGNQELIIQDIKSKMEDPGCFCETANPSGKCCLGDVQSFIKQAKA